ncbi:MAG: SNF2 helicase associated domain-containing protein [Clostridia bacterium]|nr:SNF2 helicase associated domain-containing protein [Clostridia bacterium]
MKITRDYIKRLLGTLIYSRAEDYFRSGRVIKFVSSSSNGNVSIRAVVRGAFRYHVEIDIPENDDMIFARCGCPAYETFKRCKHIGAVLLEYEDQEKLNAPLTPVKTRAAEKKTAPEVKRIYNNANASLLLTRYNPIAKSTHEGTVKLVPVLQMGYTGLEVSFTVGSDRQYVIKDLAQFQRAMEYRETIEYGQKLSLLHERSAFDEHSRRLSDFICTYISNKKAYFKEIGYYKNDSLPQTKTMPLVGRQLDDLFDICLGKEIADKEGGEKWRFLDENPSVAIQSSAAGEHLSVSLSPLPKPIQGAGYDYALIDRNIYRLSEEYAQRMLPLMEIANAGNMLFSPKGAEDFCQTVLPQIEKYAALSPNQALSPYLPSEMETRFYIDLPERSLLTARPVFQYGETALTPATPKDAYPEIRRNAHRETSAVESLLMHFDPPQDGAEEYTVTDEDRIYEFLSSGMETLSEAGEIYISDKLKNINMKKLSKVTVGVSAGESVLNLNVDTGEFPISELEELMEAMRMKKQYYRLSDGRFLTLKDSSLNGLTELADGLGLTAGDLEKGEIEVPMSRALYLDAAVKQDGDLTFHRNSDFKKLVRDFKTVDDSDFQVPPPLDGILRNYQKTGYRWLRTLDAYRFGGILADDMGLGKTLQILAYLLSIKQERKEDSDLPNASLIVCPASLILNWGEEAQKWTSEFKVCLLSQSAQEREMEIMRANEYDLVITSYDLLRRDAELHKKVKYYACILDEAQYIKNHETKSFKAVKGINACVRIALTGTPVENRLSELWSIFDFLMPGYLYRYTSFRQKLESPIARENDAHAKKTLKDLTSPFILRRMKKDVLTELPPKVETVQKIQMEEEQRKAYLAYAHHVKQTLEGANDKDKFLILSMLTRLRQICCDPALAIDNYRGESCKLEECVRMAEELTESGHVILLFSQFTSMLARIRDRLDALDIPSFTLEGATSREERAELVKRFNAGEVPVFLISLKAGGTGLNLTRADTVIHFDPWWNIAAQNQATDRCYRIGQKRKVQVYQLITKDTIEENILKLQSQKKLLADTVTDGADGGIMSMSKDDLMALID